MLPYLAALAIIATLGRLTLQMTVLAGYVVVMAAPALVLLACRQIVGDRITASLERLRAWLTKHSASVVSILLIVIGINLALNGITTVTGTS